MSAPTYEQSQLASKDFSTGENGVVTPHKTVTEPGPETPDLLASNKTHNRRPDLPKYRTEGWFPQPTEKKKRSPSRPKKKLSEEETGGTPQPDDDGYSSTSSSSEDDDVRHGISRWRTENGVPRRPNAGVKLFRALSNPRKPEYTNQNYSQTDQRKYMRVALGSDDFKTSGRVTKQGQLNVSLNESKNKFLSSTIATAIKQHLDSHVEGHRSAWKSDVGARAKANGETPKDVQPPLDTWKPKRLNIVIMVIGSRGDIQPFVKVAKVLREKHGHRVRVATHPAFKDFIEEQSGLEFFSVGGDPAQLMSYMVRNPGLIPSVASVRAGDIGKRRQQMAEMFEGFYRSCIHATDDPSDMQNMNMLGTKPPFVADAIIANPPSFAHIHCAEKLGVPMHLMFTMPWSATQAFPHPLANIKRTNIDTDYTNYVSYTLVDMMIWQGLGDLINHFRVKTLGLDPVPTLWQAGLPTKLHVPFTYLFSPGLIPKPKDWGPEIDVSGFVYLDLASKFKPPEDLVKFLDAGPPPVYIGFGSIVVDDPDAMTKMIFKAVKKAGVRALVSKGWGGLGADEMGVPEGVFMLGNIPHDWLFKRVSAVVHHGGAGTTAAALKFGKPSMIVPFFGDQPFWGNMVSKAGAGAEKAIPYKKLTDDDLANGIKECLRPEALSKAEEIARSIEAEGDGGENAVDCFHKHLQKTDLIQKRCSLLNNRIAIWKSKKIPDLRLSSIAAETLIYQGKMLSSDLRLVRHHEWNDFEGPGEPLTGGGGALLYSLSNAIKPVASMPSKVRKSLGDQKAHRHDSTTKKKPKDKNTSNNALSNGTMVGLNGVSSNPQDAPTLKRRPSSSSSTSSNHVAEYVAHEATHTASKTAKALAKIPNDLLLALAQGLHNAPRLYGDKTVRRPKRITGISSGLRAARSEFGWGIHDGWTGLVEHPYRGARKHGVKGFVVGTGRGLGGFVLKDLAALVGPVAFTLKGLEKEIQKKTKPDPTKLIRRARILQGRADWGEISSDRRFDFAKLVIERWFKYTQEHGVEVTVSRAGAGVKTRDEKRALTMNASVGRTTDKMRKGGLGAAERSPSSRPKKSSFAEFGSRSNGSAAAAAKKKEEKSNSNTLRDDVDLATADVFSQSVQRVSTR